MSSKFDLIYEKSLRMIKEQHYINSTFVDNVRLLVKMLIDNDYLPKNKNVEHVVDDLSNQTDNVKELILDTQEGAIPGIKLLIKQDSTESESFSVTVISVKEPSKQKEFQNSMLETIFEDVLNYIKTISLEGIKPDAAIEKLPPEEGAEQQPGAQTSELPTDNLASN